MSFFEEKNIDFKKYVTTNIPVNDNIKILLKSKEKIIDKTQNKLELLKQKKN